MGRVGYESTMKDQTRLKIELDKWNYADGDENPAEPKVVLILRLRVVIPIEASRRSSA